MKKNKSLIVIVLIVILLFFIFLINGFCSYKELNRNEKNVFVGIFNYYMGVYKTQDLNYTNILDFSKDENGNISGMIYSFNEKDILIEEKVIYYFKSQEEAIETYNNFKVIADSETAVTDITDVIIKDSLVTLDINSDKSKKLNDMFEKIETEITENSMFLVIK